MERPAPARRSVELRPARAVPRTVPRAIVLGAIVPRTMSGTSAVLEEFVGRDRYRDLARLRLHEMRQRIEAAIDGGAEDSDDSELPEQARHRQSLARIPLVPVNGTEYDHVRPRVASHFVSHLARLQDGFRSDADGPLGQSRTLM